MSMVSVAWPRPSRARSTREALRSETARSSERPPVRTQTPATCATRDAGPASGSARDCSAIAELSLRTPSSIRSDVTAEKFSRMASPPRPST